MQEQRQVVRTIKLWYQFFVSTAYMGVPQNLSEIRGYANVYRCYTVSLIDTFEITFKMIYCTLQ